MIDAEQTVENLRCCGNCRNNEGNMTFGSIACDFDEMNEDGDGSAVNPHALCDKWEFDRGEYKQRGRTWPK